VNPQARVSLTPLTLRVSRLSSLRRIRGLQINLPRSSSVGYEAHQRGNLVVLMPTEFTIIVCNQYLIIRSQNISKYLH